jgi:uncharacterized protein (TIGR00251 family)
VSWSDAVEEDGEGCAILVEVTAGSKDTTFPTGFNEWRGRIGMKVHARAIEGKANLDVVQAVARFFHVPPARVQIEAGHADSRKRIAIEGLSRQDAIARLATGLGEAG